MNKDGLENGGDRILLIVAAILAFFIIFASLKTKPSNYNSKRAYCSEYCHSQHRKKNTLYDIVELARTNIEFTECYKVCIE